jgi:hypothetical protein
LATLVQRRTFHQKRKHQNNITYKVKGLSSLYSWENTKEGVPIDAHIAELVSFLSNSGLPTFVSCSGLAADHPDFKDAHGGYIGIHYPSIKMRNNLVDLFEAAGWKECSVRDDILFVYLATWDPVCSKATFGDGTRQTEAKTLLIWLTTFMLLQAYLSK